MVDTHTFPNGGWAFRQAQTGWVNPMNLVGFSASIDAIRKHRLANPAISTKHQLSTDPVAIERELIAFQQARGALPPDQQAASFFARSSSLPARVSQAAAEIKIAAQGAGVVLDWIQSGGNPVSQELAEKRAKICVACPKNTDGAWYVTAPAELLKSAIKAWQELKGSDFAFETKQGDNLKSCDVCKCLMRLKVFTPLKHILDKSKPEILAAFPKENCWIARRDQ